MDWRDDPVGSAHRGENPMVMARMRSGFAVIGDTQHLPGYSLLLCENPAVDHLTDLPLDGRRAFLLDMALLGEAVERACHPRRYPDAVRAEHPYRDDEHGSVRETIRGELERLMRAAY